MALNTTPVLTATRLSGPTTLARGSVRRLVHDLTTAYGAFVFVRIGRGGTTALDVPVGIRINRLIGYAGGGAEPYATPAAYVLGHPSPVASVLGAVEAAAQSNVDANAAALDTSLTPASVIGFSAGDLITIDGQGSFDFWEVNRINRITGGAFKLDTPLIFAHTAGAAAVIVNRAEFWQFPVDGGCPIEILIDYADAATGESIDVEVFVQEYTRDTTVTV